MPTAASEKTAAWMDDEAIVSGCLAGDQAAWDALIERYKALIYSFPFRYGLDAAEAADVFQDVCVIAYQELDTLREAKALRGWLARIAANECGRRRKARARLTGELPEVADTAPETDQTVLEAEREQSVRDSVAQLGERCRNMVRMLFLDDPPRPYHDVARELGLAIGSIGFIRARCLRQLEKLLREAGR
ncbi:MAG: sigma-70 family RNA polymerase sigma factor [Bryobacterales bacterium]|nr:sigma-70 family RNA polymerase sigma factor [Bryobacterales bacterium]